MEIEQVDAVVWELGLPVSSELKSDAECLEAAHMRIAVGHIAHVLADSPELQTYVLAEIKVLWKHAYVLGQLSVQTGDAVARRARSIKREARWSVLVTNTQIILLRMGRKAVNGDKFASQIQPKLEALMGEKLTLSEIRKALAGIKRQQSTITH